MGNGGRTGVDQFQSGFGEGPAQPPDHWGLYCRWSAPDLQPKPTVPILPGTFGRHQRAQGGPYGCQSDRGYYLAASTGSLMVSLKSSLGYVRDQNPFNWLSGVEAGWTF